MHLHFKILLLCFLPAVACGNPGNKPDSLQLLLGSGAKDSITVKKCLKLMAGISQSKDFREAIKNRSKVLKLVDEAAAYPRGKVTMRLILSDSYRLAGDTTQVSFFVDEALRIARTLNRESILVEALVAKGRLLIYNGYPSEALVYLNEAEKKAREGRMKQEYVYILNHIGEIYWKRNEPAKAMDCVQRSAALCEELQDHTWHAYSLMAMSVISTELKQYNKALEFCRKALDVQLKNNMAGDIQGPMINMAEIFIDQNQLDSALIYTNRSIDASMQNNDLIGVSIGYMGLGKIYLKKEKYKLSETYLLKSLKLSKSNQDKTSEAGALTLLCELHEKQNQYSRMESYVGDAIRLSAEIADSLQLKTCYLTASRLYSKKQDFEKALKYRLLYDSLSNKTFNSENNKVINEMLAKYEMKDKQKENERLINENIMSARIIKQQRWLFYLCLLGLLLGLLLVFFILRWSKVQRLNSNLKMKSQEMELAKLREMKTLADLKALQASINPHFLYNALNSITSLIHDKPDQAEEMIIKLSHLFRYSINTQEANWATVAEELKILRNYMDIESIRFGERMQYSIYADQSILEQLIPRFLLQPLVENAIKHGLKHKNENGVLSISIKDKDKTIEITVADNGSPFPEEIKPGYGLQSINDKLHLLYKDDWKMTFVNAGEKKICLEIPKIREPEQDVKLTL